MKKEISYFKAGQMSDPSEAYDLEEIAKMITSDPGLQRITQEVRSLLSDDKKYKEAKSKRLPSVTFGGRFDYRNLRPEKLAEKGRRGLESPSGYVVIDIDHLSEKRLSPEWLRSSLEKDSELGARLIFVSPSGDGLKMVCQSSRIIGPDSYKEAFLSLEYYINSTYYPGGEIVDNSGKDITRLCFLCSDPEAIWRESVTPFDPERHPVPKKERGKTQDVRIDLPGDDIEELVRRVEASGKDIAPTYGPYFPLVYSFTALGERGRSLLHRVCSLSSKYNRENTEKDWEYCSKVPGQSIGYFVNRCKDNGIDVSFGKLRPAPVQRKRKGSPTPQEEPVETPEERFGEYLQIKDLRELASTKKEGILTDYTFKDSRGREKNLILPSGALSLVCAKSSQGKSRFLQNLALQIAKEKGGVLYFSFEESDLEVITRLANIYTGVPGLGLSQRGETYGPENTEVILDYFSTGDLNKVEREKRAEASSKLEEFRSSLYESGKLRVFYTPDLRAEELCSLIEWISSRMTIRAVFLDYVQAIYKEGYKGDRREELREICKDLTKTAISLDVPIVLSAQLNRETPNPSDMSEDNIAESADITRYANTILLLWDSAFDRVKGGKDTYLETEAGNRLQEKGFRLGEPGKTLAVISKNRGGTPYLQAVLDYDGETGEVKTNNDLPEEEDKPYSPQVF